MRLKLISQRDILQRAPAASTEMNWTPSGLSHPLQTMYLKAKLIKWYTLMMLMLLFHVFIFFYALCSPRSNKGFFHSYMKKVLQCNLQTFDHAIWACCTPNHMTHNIPVSSCSHETWASDTGQVVCHIRTQSASTPTPQSPSHVMFNVMYFYSLSLPPEQVLILQPNLSCDKGLRLLTESVRHFFCKIKEGFILLCTRHNRK